MTEIEQLYLLCLLVSLILSFYFFINSFVLRNNTHSITFTTWQFPTLFAIFIDSIYKIYI